MERNVWRTPTGRYETWDGMRMPKRDYALELYLALAAIIVMRPPKLN